MLHDGGGIYIFIILYIDFCIVVHQLKILLVCTYPIHKLVEMVCSRNGVLCTYCT